MSTDDKFEVALQAIREAGQVTAVLDGLSNLRASDLLHQFALAALPEIIRAHPGYAAKTVAIEAYSIASYMVEQGKRAEMEVRNPKFDEAEAARINAIAEERLQKMAQCRAV